MEKSSGKTEKGGGDALFDMLDKAWEDHKNKEKAGIDPMKSNGLAGYEEHRDDLFHPDNIFNKTRNFPKCPSSANAARVAAENIILDENEAVVNLRHEDKHVEAAKLFLLAQANSFQHKFLQQYGKKLVKKAEANMAKCSTKVNTENKENEEEEEDEQFEVKQKRLMLFDSFDKTDVINNLSSLPATWTVVQISGHDPLVTRFKKTKASSPCSTNPSLTLVRMTDSRVRVARCAGPASDNCRSFLEDFKKIIDEHIHINKNPTSKYHQMRKKISSEMRTFVTSFEESWLGFEKATLMGTLEKSSDRDVVESVITECISTELVPSQREFLRTLLSSTPFLKDDQILTGLTSVLNCLSEDEKLSLTKTAKSKLKHLATASRNPVIFILDSEVQSLPWESLPIMTKSLQAASRVPSLPFLHALWSAHKTDTASVVSSGVAQDNVFYVLNPDKNLAETQKRLEGALKAWASWEGVVGEAPKKPQLEGALQGKDAFLYCGHGSGSKYLSVDEIEKVGLCCGCGVPSYKILSCLQLRVRAVPVLVGCNSGQLTRQGRSLDPLGTAQSYLVAATPALVSYSLVVLAHCRPSMVTSGWFPVGHHGPGRGQVDHRLPGPLAARPRHRGHRGRAAAGRGRQEGRLRALHQRGGGRGVRAALESQAT